MPHPPDPTTNALLGYPDDARLLLVNADDLGMYPAINEGVVRAFRDGIVRSTSLMVPCPGAADAIQRLKEHPDLPFGVHLSIVRDIADYRWGPLAAKERVPSLLDEAGDLYRIERMDDLLAHARLDELEIEFRAQIETVLASGLRPTHVDWHCLYSGGRADIFDLTARLATEFGFALRVDYDPFAGDLRRRGLPTADHGLLDSFAIDIETKTARYADLLRRLPPGLSSWAVHPSIGDAPSRAIDPDGWRVRRTDYDFLVSPAARQIINEEGIIPIDYAPLQAVWRRASA